jgi:Flp pilus assembly protein TadB
MAFWVATVGGSAAAGGTLMVVMLIFLAFAAVNYYMARRIQKFLKQLPIGTAPAQAKAANEE